MNIGIIGINGEGSIPSDRLIARDRSSRLVGSIGMVEAKLFGILVDPGGGGTAHSDHGDSSLSPVVRLRFRMNEHFEQFRGFLLEADFEPCGDVVDAGERQIVGHGAVA